eukprot:541689_1
MAEQKETETPSIKISYFHFNGRGAPLRAAAAIGGLSYEDNFVTFQEHKAAKIDGTRRWSGLPELSVYDKDGKVIATVGQSNACIRYIGKLTGLYPTNPVEAALVDEILDSAEDTAQLLTASMREKDAEKKKAMREALLADDKLPYWAKKFETRFEENEKRGCNNGFVVGDKLTIADIKVYFMAQWLCSGIIDYIDGNKLFADSKKMIAMVEKLKVDEKMAKFEKEFAAQQKDNKENKTKSFKKKGKGSYGA